MCVTRAKKKGYKQNMVGYCHGDAKSIFNGAFEPCPPGTFNDNMAKEA